MKANNSLANTDGNKVKFSQAIMGNALQTMIAKSVPSKDDASRMTGALLQIVSSSPQLQNCKPATIVASALRGEGMGLILGEGYYVIPYKDTASFRISYKGIIQLAIASGKYTDIDCLEVREGEMKGRNPRTGKPTVDFSVYETDEERMKHPVVGYYAYFELKDGMFKSEYWSLEKLLEHADRTPAPFQMSVYKKILDGKVSEKDMWKYSSPWYDYKGGGQEKMCKKTVLRSLLNSGYAPLTSTVRTILKQDAEEERTGERVVSPETIKLENELDGLDETTHEEDDKVIDVPEENIKTVNDAEMSDEELEAAVQDVFFGDDK